MNLIIDGCDHKLNKDVVHALSEVNRYVFSQINFELNELDCPGDSTNIFNFEINKGDINVLSSSRYYGVVNLTIDEKTVLNLNKPSRTVRYLRRQIVDTKRKHTWDDEDENIVSKKPTVDDEWIDMVSASAVRNYLLNDPLIDYLKEYSIHNVSTCPTKITNNNTFTNFIMKSGIEFENELINILKKNHKIVKVAEYFQSRNKAKFNETIKLMKSGTPIIYQAVLHNYDNKTFGLPDLLVRSDYINTLMGYQVIDDTEATMRSPNLDVDWHYKVIDIKHSNIPLRSDGVHILNSESIPAYKGQLYIYTIALNKVLGIDIKKAFIWGKKYTWESKKNKYEITDFLNKLGTIDYDNIDSDYGEQTSKAIEWIKTIRNEGANWSLIPLPTRNELFPNMKNEKDGMFHKIKSDLSNKIKEITSVVYCGIKQRNFAHAKHVYKWTDTKCTAKNMGFNKGKQSTIVDAVLNINRQNVDIIRPSNIQWDKQNWKYKDNKTVEFYIDFETLNSNFGSIIKEGIISYDNNQFIFMIGVGYVKKGVWTFKNFVMKDKLPINEILMFEQFYDYIDNVLKKERKSSAKFYHWSGAEPIAYTRFKQRNPIVNFRDNNWQFYDLYQVFLSEPIVVKGALNFSLKTIAKALKSHNLIESSWDQYSPCANGLSAMILANKLYESPAYRNENEDITLDTTMKEIMNYNEIDCKVMYEIHDLIKNH
jgi:hypothetical protein